MATPIIILPVPQVEFSASLLGVNGAGSITSNKDCTTLTINDQSNYTNNTESGHAAANFSSFRRILIEHYLGTIINLSSIGDGDVAITPGSSGINQFNQLVQSGDGRYDITLRTVPDWDNAATYNPGDDCVFVPGASLPTSGVFYECINSNTNSNPASNPLDWQVILETDLPVKYDTTIFIVLDCALLACINEKVSCAFCTMNDAFCNVNLCTNRCFLEASQLLLLLYAIEIDTQNQDQEGVDLKFDMVKKICGCPPLACN